jgi:hypothetical protein
MQLEIISHCWQYGRQLTHQLSSLLLFAPSTVNVVMTVVFASEDHSTKEVLDYFEAFEAPHIRWNWCCLTREKVFRRAFGRNQAALATTADWVWFADADMCFRSSCLDELAGQLRGQSTPLVYPRIIRISHSHEAGESALNRVATGPALIDIDPAEFVPWRYDRAIGGVQIVPGDIARSRGYLNGRRRLFKVPISFGGFSDDIAFRRSLGTDGSPINLDGVYRIRHLSRLPVANDSSTTSD